MTQFKFTGFQEGRAPLRVVENIFWGIQYVLRCPTSSFSVSLGYFFYTHTLVVMNKVCDLTTIKGHHLNVPQKACSVVIPTFWKSLESFPFFRPPALRLISTAVPWSMGISVPPASWSIILLCHVASYFIVASCYSRRFERLRMQAVICCRCSQAPRRKAPLRGEHASFWFCFKPPNRTCTPFCRCFPLFYRIVEGSFRRTSWSACCCFSTRVILPCKRMLLVYL